MNVRIIKPSIALSQYLEDVVPRSHFYTDVVGNGRHHIISKFTSEDCAGVEVRRNGL